LAQVFRPCPIPSASCSRMGGTAAMTARAVAVWVVFGKVCIAAEHAEKRRFPDDEVMASQSYFSHSWRDHFNKGDFAYCGGSYLENASLHVALGPTASDLKQLLGLQDPAVIRGQGPITDFWNLTFSKAGFRDLRAYEEQGDYKSNTFVVDDNTVIVEGHFAFSALKGQIFSELWVREGEEWKLRSAMLAFQEMQPGAKLGIAPAPASAPASSRAAPQNEKEKDQKQAAGGAVTAKTEEKSKVLPVGNASLDATGIEKNSSGSSAAAFWILVILLALVVTGIMLRRKNKRKEAAIAGFEVMLG